MNKLGTKLGAIAMSAVMALTFAPSAAITSLAASGDGLLDATLGVEAVERLYNPNSGEHLFTTDGKEISDLVKLGWNDEGVAWKAPLVGEVPVYRLYNPNNGDHHYTTSLSERADNLKQGWKNDNDGDPVFYGTDSADLDAIPVYRLFNPNEATGTHHYTTSAKEKTDLLGLGWNDEGSKFSGYPSDYEPEEPVEELTVKISNTTPKVGDTLSAIVVPVDTIVATYEWYADKTKLDETDDTLEITSDMVGKKISVKVTDLAGQVKTSEATAAVEKDFPELANVLQESSNQILLMFDTDASEITTSDIVVERDEDDLVNPVEKVELLDPTTILATLSSVLIDDTLYNVTVGADTTSFRASVGEVASIEILTTEAEVNKPTKIEYRLLDKNGVDVTSTQKLKETVLVDITGTYKTAKTSDPTNISVTMGAVDDECEVTISYNKGTGSDESVEPKTQKIVCVGPTAMNGTIKYCITDDVNFESGCAKFYLDNVGTTGKVTIAVGDDTSDDDPVYFSAFDDNGAAIEYDQYEVESANEAIVAATVRNDATNGKFTKIDLVGNEVGTTQVKVIATNNTVSKEYFINVTVKNTEDMVKVILSDSRDRKLSNAFDVAYTDKITAKIVDDNNQTADYETIEWKLLNEDNYKVADSVPEAFQGTFGWVNGAGYDGLEAAYVKAWGAKKGTYTVQATADIADTKIAQTLKINVSELPAKAWIGTLDAGVKLNYMVEVGSSSIGNIDTDNDIKLYALVNGLFAGYVRQGAIADEDIAGPNGAAKVTVSAAWAAKMATDGYTEFRTDKMDAADADLSAAELNAAAGNVAVPDDLFTVITASGAGVEVTDYHLSQYAYPNVPAAGAMDEDTAGAYGIAEPGQATDGGEIGVGLSEDGNPTIQPNAASTIADGTLKWTIKFGNKKLATEELFGYLEAAATGADEEAFYDDAIEAVASRAFAPGDPDLTYIANDKSYDHDFARPGRYNVVLTYVNASTFKSATAENEFTVTDTVKNYVPKVTLLTKTTSDYSLDSFKEILTLNVDLNNNDGLAESLKEAGLMTKWTDRNLNGYIDGDEREPISSGDTYAKYAIVLENVEAIPVLFFVPVGANIKED